MSLISVSFGEHIAQIGCLNLEHIFSHGCAVEGTYTLVPVRNGGGRLDKVDYLAVAIAVVCWGGFAEGCAVGADNSQLGLLFAGFFAPIGTLMRFYISAELNSKRRDFPMGTFL
ncbi:hypothetical protein HK104_001063, partial [Borealophlyctis nickersoniae]